MLLTKKKRNRQSKGCFLALILFTFVLQGYSAQAQYCTPHSSAGTGNISSFIFNSINDSSTANPSGNGYVLNNNVLTTPLFLARNYAFQVSLSRKGSFAIWIDYDGNGDFNDSDEFVFNDSASNHFSGIINIQPTAAEGQTRIRIRTNFGKTIGPGQSCANFSDGETRDYDIILADSGKMQIDYSNVVNISDSAFAGQNNAKIALINLVTSGYKNPLQVNGFYFSDSDFANLADIKNAKLFYTGYNSFDSTPLMIQDSVGAPVKISGINFYFPANVLLNTGNNYFWLTYDVSPNGNTGDYLSALADSVSLSSGMESLLSSGWTWPGNWQFARKIVARYDYKPLKVLYPNKLQDRMLGITSFNFAGISNITTDNDSLTYYDNLTATAYRQQPYQLTMKYGKGYAAQVGGWVDWNNDGYFDNETERFFYNPNSPAANTYDTVITISCNIKPGLYKMRVLSDGIDAPGLNVNNNLFYGNAMEYYIRILNDTLPKASFIKDSVYYTGISCTFKNSSLLNSNCQYQWDFNNDGDYDTTATNGSYTFIKPGIYKISLKLTFLGCDTTYSNVFTDSIHVINAPAIPVSNFTSDTNFSATGQKIHFTDLSSNGPLYWKWQISPAIINGVSTYFYADSTNAGSQNPVIIFTQTGLYTISLTAGNALGTGNNEKKNDYISVIQTVDMCSGTDTVTSSSGYLFDDGGPWNPYGSNKDCHLLIHSVCGLPVNLSFYSFDVSIYNLSKSGRRAGDYLRIYDGADTTGTPLHFKAGFPLGFQNLYPGNISPSIPLLTAMSGNMYIVWHTDSSFEGDGFAARWNMQSSNAPATIASFDVPDTVWQYQKVSFINISQGAYLVYAWDTNGSGNYILNDTNLQKQFIIPGLHTVSLYASGCGGSSYYTRSIFVKLVTGAPKAAFSANYTRAGVDDNISFNDLSSNGPANWRWHIIPLVAGHRFNFNAGTDSFSQNPIVAFTDTGQYSVSLSVKNIKGADSIIKNNYMRIYSYCTPTAKRISGDIDISSLLIKGPAGNTVLNSEGTSGASAYSHIQLSSVPVFYRLENYIFNINRDSGADAMDGKVWIDLDGDGVFNDSNELVINKQNITGKGWGETVFIPFGSINGLTRVRIGVSLHNDPLNSCDSVLVGKFEDISIAIMPDFTRPVISLRGNDTVVLETPLPYIDAGATAYDNAEGNISGKITTTGIVNVNQTGDYSIKYYVHDNSGNAAIPVTRLVKIIKDTTRPLIFIIGDHHPFIEVHTAFIDSSAFGDDTIFWVRDSAYRTGYVDTSKIGVYTITYTATDSFGNIGVGYRVVTVRNTARPIITLNGEANMTIGLDSPYREPGAKASDWYWKNVKVSISGHVNTSKMGKYIISYNADDSSGNIANTVYRTVMVNYLIPPGLRLNGPDSENIEVYHHYRAPLFTVSDSFKSGIQILKKGYVDNYLIGEDTIQYYALDSFGNISNIINYYVFVVDTEPPVISLIGDSNVNVIKNSNYSDSGYIYSDNYDIDPVITTGGTYANTRQNGRFTLTYQAMDQSGNKSNLVTRYITVYDSSTAIKPNTAPIAGFITIYPNPAKDVVYALASNFIKGPLLIGIFDDLGNRISAFTYSKTGKGIIKINVEKIPAGLYFIKYSLNGEQYTQKLVIVK